MAGATQPSSADNLLQQARAFYEPQLERLQLSEDQINNQSLEELQGSLSQINELIAHPESMGVFRVMVTAQANIIINTTSSERHTEVGALPLLLERKSQILQRISSLRQAKGIGELEKVVSGVVVDPISASQLFEEIRKTLTKQVDEEKKLALQLAQTDEARQRSLLFEVELKERKSAMYRTWIERESVASIIGALLLLGLGIALIIAMFLGTAVTEIVTSSFLVILGYFFGQTTTRSKSNDADESSK